MNNSNKSKEKNPALEEIEKETPEVIPEIPTFKLNDLVAKDPDEITAEEQDFLADNVDDLTDEQKVAFGLIEKEDVELEEGKAPVKEPVVEPIKPEAETQEEKDRKYKAQQAEAQIQAEKSKSIAAKAEQAANIADPTEAELRSFVAQDGANWDELTTFEQSMTKRTYISEKRSQLVLEAVQEGKKVDEWAGKVDTFIETTDGKPEFIELSGNEADFRKFAMKEAHRGTPIDVLLPAFLHQLPPKKQNRGDLFLKGGGGEKQVQKDGLMDAEQVAKLRTSNPKEYKRLIKAGKVRVEV
jgi:hypothetical protein